jgi:AmmeMemoRadiSam system protein B
MTRIRPAAVAGIFYPGDAARLADAVGRALDVAVPDTAPAPKAIIVPHAGYEYSGATAGTAYARVARLRGMVTRVVLLGPAHRRWIHGLAVSAADGFATPLGVMRVDDELRRRALTHPQVMLDDAPHAGEHSLEVQLPFLQRTLGNVTLLPLAVGEAEADDVAAVLDLVWGGPETLIVVSSDLSHYLDHASATVRDRHTASMIVEERVAALAPDDACGASPVRGLLVAGSRHGVHPCLLDLRNSGDTAGSSDRVVGYGAFALRAA